MPQDPTDYRITQSCRDQEYTEAWRSASPEFLEQCRKLGIDGPKVDEEDRNVMEFDAGRDAGCAPEPTIDSAIDALIEKHGCEKLVLDVVRSVTALIQAEIEREQAEKLGRVVMYLVRGESRNLLPHIHGLMHAIPGLAAEAGFASSRESARSCRVSPEWMIKCRDEWCSRIGLQPPKNGAKSEAVRKKYSFVARSDHWRNRVFTSTQTTQKPCTAPQRIQKNGSSLH